MIRSQSVLFQSSLLLQILSAINLKCAKREDRAGFSSFISEFDASLSYRLLIKRSMLWFLLLQKTHLIAIANATEHKSLRATNYTTSDDK